MSDAIETSVALMDAIFHRRAVRSYDPRLVEKATVDKLLAAAVQAPSALNSQPWGFAVLHGDKRLRAYSERAKKHLVVTYPTTWELHSRSELYGNPSYDLFHGANTLIVIYANSGGTQPAEDCCLAAENLMLAAYGLGLGSCPIGFARSWFDLPDTKRELGVPDHFTAVFPIVIGYPAGFTCVPPREEPNVISWKWDEA
jgi:nitroreductase